VQVPQGVWGDVATCEWPLELLPLEDDVLSLELDGGFRVGEAGGFPGTIEAAEGKVLLLTWRGWGTWIRERGVKQVQRRNACLFPSAGGKGGSRHDRYSMIEL
jgi:hypothetical protein